MGCKVSKYFINLKNLLVIGIANFWPILETLLTVFGGGWRVGVEGERGWKTDLPFCGG